MTPFLKQIAQLYYNRLGLSVSDCCFVVPNRRAGLFFRQYLSEVASGPLFSPVIITISDLFRQWSPLYVADRTTLLFVLYDVYRQLSHTEETFDDFIYWGEMLLGDFDDIDKYMVDAEKVYTLVADLKEVDSRFDDYLTEEQLTVIHRFWDSFIPVGDRFYKQEFIRLWQLLHPLYVRFKETLEKQKIGYEGMIIRRVVEELEVHPPDLPYDQVVFVGLNALTKAEEQMMTYLKREGKADFYWDYASSKVRDTDNRASHFMAENLVRFPSKFVVEEDEETEPEITLVGIPSAVGQTKQLYPVLEQLYREGAGEEIKTAVVLPDEMLLQPLLYAIPDCYSAVNVTMGYPLKETPMAGLIDGVVELQQTVRSISGERMFYHRPLLQVLNHRYLRMIAPEAVERMSGEILKHNKIFVSEKEFESDKLLKLIFTVLLSDHSPADYLMEVIDTVVRHHPDWQPNGETGETVPPACSVEQEFAYHYYLALQRMKEMSKLAVPAMKLETWFRMMRRLVAGTTIPYEGEPLSGLQVMGLLETRSLDFENLVMLSMNEGMFPARRAANTFIPHNIRDAFGLPTYKHQDAVWAYHFYRLIHRARNVYFFYDTRTDGLQSGEVSRYVHQLRYHYRVPIRELFLNYRVSSTDQSPIVIEKNGEVMKFLSQYLAGEGTKCLSASAINTYLDCPLKFYFDKILGIEEADEVSESVESSTFGSIFHKVMELIYRRFERQQVTSDLLNALKKNDDELTRLIERAFASEYFKSDRVQPLRGQNKLIGEVIRKYVKRVLEIDAGLGLFTYLKSEERVETTYPLRSSRRVNLLAFIDRMDEVKGITRIVDYKSGRTDLKCNSVAQLFDPTLATRPKAIMQVMIYSMLIALRDGRAKTQPVIYSLRDLFGAFSPDLSIKGQPIENFDLYREEFDEQFSNCLSELFDPSVPFTQTSVEEHCTYCAFKQLCRR